MKLEIRSYCRITNDSVSLNGNIVPIERSSNEQKSWLNDIYRSLKISYLKFFKMDNLAKAGFLGAELVCNDMEMDRNLSKKDIAVVCFNRSSSLDDDTVYQQTIQNPDDYYPSPSVFVYTLANIVTGEIAIRNKIEGESSFYITEKFSPQLICDAIEDIFIGNTVNGLLCGWTEYYKNHCDVLMMYIRKNNDPGKEVTKENILKLFK